ncbi:hypothetical protein BH23ACT6_BH23ACT6_25970 [soil metagenome]
MCPDASALWTQSRSAEDIGAFLAEVRREHGWTQAELARRLGVPRRAVYEIETGKSTQYVDRLLAILRLLRVSLELRAEAPIVAASPSDAAGHDVDLTW